MTKLLPENYHSSWGSFFTEERIEELKEIESKIGYNYFPKTENVFRFLENDIKTLKCVLVGMDPYPSQYKKDGVMYPVATGRSFEVGNLNSFLDKFKQSSLQNIVKTIYYNETGEMKSLNDIRELIKDNSFNIKEPHDWFDSMEKQGVLFLNATLTVEPGKSGAHVKIWDSFMSKLIDYIVEQNNTVKWLLWGKNAQELILPHIDEANAVMTCHPRLAGFVKENCFAKFQNLNWLG